MSNRRFLSQPRQTLMVNNVPICSSDTNEEIKLNEQVVARLKSRASRARKFRKRKSKVVPLNEYFEELNSEHKNSEEEIKSKPNKEVDDVKNYEIFPKKRLQDKIDRFLSPYNKTYNFRKCMNFEEGVEANIINQVDSVQPTQSNHKWNKISDFILNQKGDFLRKSLRCINKDLYKNCEEMSKSMIKITPRRSNCKDQAFYRFQSIRSSLSSANKRLSYAKKKSGASYLKIPTIVEANKQTKEEIEEEDDQVDEENISKALCIMKVIKQTKRSSSIESKTSSETDTSEEEEVSPNDFDQFLNELKSSKKKIARNINKSTRRMNTDMIKYNIRVQSYEPVSKSNQVNDNLLREKPNLRIFAERRLNKCISETFRSEK